MSFYIHPLHFAPHLCPLHFVVHRHLHHPLHFLASLHCSPHPMPSHTQLLAVLPSQHMVSFPV
jgi:hypothetical protein